MRTFIDKEELPKLFELEKSLFEATAWSFEVLKKELENPLTKLFVLEDEFCEIVGYTIVRVLLDEAEILRLGIRKDKQGKGLGKALLKFVLDVLRKSKVKKVFLEVAFDNVRAQRLYESLDFKRVGERKAYYSPGRSAYIMCKILNEEVEYAKGGN